MTAETSLLPPAGSPLAADGWESECDTERAKISVRWMAIILLLGALLWIRAHSPIVHISNTAIAGIAAAAVLMTCAEALYLWRPGGNGSIPRGFKYVTVFGDMAFVSALIYITGCAQSPFFFVYFVFLISNCLRYGLLMSLFVALTFNVLYVLVLALAPPEARTSTLQGGEGLKFLAFWAVAFYGGSVSARLRRQANQLRVYEETLLELRARLKAETSPASLSAPPPLTPSEQAEPKTAPSPQVSNTTASKAAPTTEQAETAGDAKMTTAVSEESA